MHHVVIIGGGITGLATALNLQDRAPDIPPGLRITVLEAGARLGGNIHTDSCAGFTIEQGPNGYLDNVPAMQVLVQRLGLGAEIQTADDSASKRYLYRNGRLNLLPTGPLSFLGSRVLSVRGRIRVMLEPFARAKPRGVDETIHEFASRRIGPEAAEILIDAMVSGVFAGNTRELSLASAFPRMAAMEAEHGSLVRAMIARQRARRKQAGAVPPSGGPAGPGGTLTSFRPGLAVLIERLAGTLDAAIHCNYPVATIEASASKAHTGHPPGWRVVSASGETLQADAVVVAIPSAKAAPLLLSVDSALGDITRQMPVAGLATIALGYEANAIGGAPDGFGFLVPRSEGLRILGCLYDSSIFPGRAPADQVLLRVMLGGAHDPLAVELDDESMLSLVCTDLNKTMGIAAAPILKRIYRHPGGIAQYATGHQQRLDSIQARLHELPGLWVAGSAYYGVSMNACVEKAALQTEEILGFLGSLPAPASDT